MIFSLIGAPGSGKGTQGKLLAKELGYVHFSMGDFLRKEIALKTPLGIQISQTLTEELHINNISIFENLAIEILKGKLNSCSDIIIDGFPRTLKQAQFLKEYSKNNLEIIYFQAPDTKILNQRILKRVTCEKCGTSFTDNLLVCDSCGIKLKKRKEDTSKNFNNRLIEFNTYIEEILEFYQSHSNIIHIDALNSREAIHYEIKSKIGGLINAL